MLDRKLLSILSMLYCIASSLIAQGTFHIRAGKVLTMAGAPGEGILLNGEILVRNGKIVAIGQRLKVPDGARLLRFPDHFLTPGFIELHCHVGVPRGDINDMVLPHNMELRTLDLVRLKDARMDDAVAAGITTALIIPGSGTSIGGLGTLVKTAGKDFKERLIRFPGALKIAFHARGGNPARRAGDLGSNRMGLHYMLKVVMRQAKDYHEAMTAFEQGKSADKPRRNIRLESIRGLFRREYPCLLHAYGSNDTMTAIRILKQEIGVDIVISHGMYNSYEVKRALFKSGVPMNLGPRQFEFDQGRFMGNAGILHAAGIPVSICTDAPVVAQDQLPLQAAMAARLGLPTEAALRGLTIEPAKAIGIAHRIGSLAVGKDADLVVTPGDPLDPRNRPVFVMVSGRIQLDRR